MEQPAESPTFQEGNVVRAKEKGLLMSNANTEPVFKKGGRCACVAFILALHTSSV
jgi:hypothetical protein